MPTRVPSPVRRSPWPASAGWAWCSWRTRRRTSSGTPADQASRRCRAAADATPRTSQAAKPLHPADNQRCVQPPRMACQPRHRRPHKQAHQDHFHAVVLVGKVSAEGAQHAVDPQKRSTQQTQLPVRRFQVGANRREQREDHLPVQVVQHRHHPQQADYEPGGARRFHAAPPKRSANSVPCSRCARSAVSAAVNSRRGFTQYPQSRPLHFSSVFTAGKTG